MAKLGFSWYLKFLVPESWHPEVLAAVLHGKDVNFETGLDFVAVSLYYLYAIRMMQMNPSYKKI